ncbi:SOS response-associated peptidase [Sabulicella rubraurantiaca]|uniref:SOS response-associated peptidase n=1 Tax=Sabulicella rubraurantiaca TaxID=2811429 RepID=UPI001A96C7EF|nr:SOS response-associated peptidase [Sabulicella rubraurantiaca]
MCGRYFLQRPNAETAQYFEVTAGVPNWPPSFNIAPTQSAPVVRRNPETGARHLDVLQWGLVPSWAKDAKGGARLINARADGVATKPSFREAFRRRRCLVPMDGFFEWHAGEGRKQPYAVALRNGSPMAAAGLWEGWKAEDGSWLRTYSVVTTDSAGRQALLHHRMPVLLERPDWPLWLSEEEGDAEALLRPLDDGKLRFWPVDPRVGRVGENDAALLEPWADAPPVAGLMDDRP